MTEVIPLPNGNTLTQITKLKSFGPPTHPQHSPGAHDDTLWLPDGTAVVEHTYAESIAPPPPSAGPTPSANVPVGQLAFTDYFTDLSKWYKASSNWGGMGPWDPTLVSLIAGGGVELGMTQTMSSCITTDPANLPGGFTMKYGVLDVQVIFPVVNGLVANWLSVVLSAVFGWPKNGEEDMGEGSGGWTKRGLGSLTTNYHQAAPGSITPANPYGNNLGSGITPEVQPVAGEPFNLLLNRQPGVNNVYWQGQNIWSYATSDAGSDQFIYIGGGAGPQGSPGNFPFIIKSVNVWSPVVSTVEARVSRHEYQLING